MSNRLNKNKTIMYKQTYDLYKSIPRFNVFNDEQINILVGQYVSNPCPDVYGDNTDENY